MSVSGSQLKVVFETIHAAYDDLSELTILLQFGMDLNLDDVSSTANTNRKRVFDLVTRVQARGRLADLIELVLGDPQQAGNAEMQTALGPLLAVLRPEPGVPSHNHLLTNGIAYANRSTLRHSIGDMTLIDGPRAMFLRGTSLSGTSYTWNLINHVARNGGIEGVRIDFGQGDDDTPMGLALLLAVEMSVSPPPPRNDNPSRDQLAAYVVRWLSGQLRNSEKTWWIVFDNVHRVTVPPETKEMIVALARHCISGAVDNIRVFVLGFEDEVTGIAPPHGIDLTLPAIGRPELVEYFNQASQRLGDLQGFATADEAVDDVLSGIDLTNPTRDELDTISAQLTEIVTEMRQ